MTCPNHTDRPAHAQGLCRGCYDKGRRSGDAPATKAAPGAERASTTINYDAGEATITGPESVLDGSTVDDLIRENGLDPDDWVIVSTTLNRWNGLGKAVDGENPVVTLRQVKVTLRLRPERIFPQAAAHVPELVRPAPVRVSVDEPDLILIEGDHQAPYNDPQLDALATRVTNELRPVEHVFLGDLMDFPTVSRHPDHPAVNASTQACLDAGYGIVRRRAEAHPAAVRKMVPGNHDFRLQAELLNRAERMYGITPVGESVPALSIRRLLHFDALGVELVEDPRGWDHAEVELVPGMHGLVVRHGWLTGANTAGRSLLKRGRSILVGHDHHRDHVYQWDPSAGVERQAAVLGAMCLVRDERFPHYSVCDAMLQGLATVTRWRDGRFKIEHAEYADGSLSWRDRRWTAE